MGASFGAGTSRVRNAKPTSVLRPNGLQEIGSAQLAMPTLALCFGFIFVLATGVFYFAAELSGQGAGWALLLCRQAPALCVNSQPLIYAASVMFLAYLGLDRLSR